GRGERAAPRMKRDAHAVELPSRRDALALALGAAVHPGSVQAALQSAAPRSVNVRYYGTDSPPPREIPLRAGPLTLLFEPELGQIRYVRYRDREVVRVIYAAVRDRNWGTVAPKFSNLKIETTDDAFVVAFDAQCREGDIDFAWQGRIQGD